MAYLANAPVVFISADEDEEIEVRISVGHTEHTNENGYSFKPANDDRYEWVEKTQETLMSANKEYGNGHCWNGSRNSTVVDHLTKLSHRGYGNNVSSWLGGRTHLDREVADERREERKRNHDNQYDEELDLGRKGTSLQKNGHIRQTELNEGVCANLKELARWLEGPGSTLSRQTVIFLALLWLVGLFLIYAHASPLLSILPPPSNNKLYSKDLCSHWNVRSEGHVTNTQVRNYNTTHDYSDKRNLEQKITLGFRGTVEGVPSSVRELTKTFIENNHNITAPRRRAAVGYVVLPQLYYTPSTLPSWALRGARDFIPESAKRLAEGGIYHLGKCAIVVNQNQVGSWSTKDKLTSPVVYDRGRKQYVGVFIQSQLRLWARKEEHLDKIKKHKFKLPIYHVFSENKDDPVVVFLNGLVLHLSDALQKSKEEYKRAVLKPDQVIEDCKLVTHAHNKYVIILTRNSRGNSSSNESSSQHLSPSTTREEKMDVDGYCTLAKVNGEVNESVLFPSAVCQLLNATLNIPFSDVTLLPYLRNVSFSHTLILLRYLVDFQIDEVDTEVVLDQEHILEWITLLLDAHYQQYLLSKDPQILSLVKKLRHFIDIQLSYMEELKSLAPLLQAIAAGKPLKKRSCLIPVTSLPILLHFQITNMATKLPKPKKMLNTVSSAVDDALAGLVMINKGLVILENERVVMRRDHASMIGKVKLISGGGSGHEPTPTGFVGQGMLTAVVMGDIFMAPPTSAILKTIKEIGKDHHEGVLLIVHNYMGDRLNFGIALERALSEGMKVKMLVVGEDCSMPDVPKVEGRRGLTGCILIHKMAGAMAEEGRSLEDIFQRCKSLAVSDMATINVGWNLTSTLARNAEVPLLTDEEAELGLGFNYEPGIHTIPLGTTAEVVQIMLAHMINSDSMTHISLDTNCGIALLINNVGGSSKLEEQVFAMETLRQLLMNGYKVKRSYSGSFMTSLDMLGFSITLLNLSSPDILRYLDAPTSAPAWPRTLCGACSAEDDSHDNLPIYVQGRIPYAEMEMDRRRKLLFGPHISEKSGQSLLQVLSFAVDALIACEKQLNVNDMDGGDGDCGTTLRQGAVSVKQALNAGHFNSWRPYAVLEIISSCCERSMGGITGALYSIFFAAASKTVRETDVTCVACQPFYAMREDAVVNAQSWLDALQAGTKAIMLYGQAEEGDRTMVDSLVAAANALKATLDIDPDDHVEAARSAAMAAESATQTTIRSEARIGKARTFKGRSFLQPDPGAHAISKKTIKKPPPWSCAQSSWLQTQRFRCFHWFYTLICTITITSSGHGKALGSSIG
uniref:Triokinase/FMN cyclase n=1 Tax=Timema cristinae TaxID=61476 RepID=A0A7R9CEN4_TIMCR|nr:unnamed protein product [Timema cristinae]